MGVRGREVAGGGPGGLERGGLGCRMEAAGGGVVWPYISGNLGRCGYLTCGCCSLTALNDRILKSCSAGLQCPQSPCRPARLPASCPHTPGPVPLDESGSDPALVAQQAVLQAMMQVGSC